jgi:spore germination protein KC
MEKKIILDGSAVIKGTKLAGWLTKTETRGVLFLKGEISEALIVVPYRGGKMSVEIGDVRTELVPQIKDGKPKVKVNIKGTGRLGETDVFVDFGDIDQVKEIEKILNQRLVGEINNSIKKFQGQYNADLLGIGDLFFRSNRKWWNENKDNWFEGLYQQVVFDIKADIQLDNSGFLVQPILGGE